MTRFYEAARRYAIYLPVALLVVLGLRNYADVELVNASPWVSGGFGMHATFDSVLFRFVRIYGIDGDGRQHRIKVKRTWNKVPIVARPVAANAERLVRRMQSRRPEPMRRFEAFRIELWQYTFPSGDPRLGARVIAAHRVSARP